MKIIFAASASEVMLKSGINFKIHQPEKDVDKHDCSLTGGFNPANRVPEIRHVRPQSQFKHFNVFPDTQLCTEMNLSPVPALIHDRV